MFDFLKNKKNKKNSDVTGVTEDEQNDDFIFLDSPIKIPDNNFAMELEKSMLPDIFSNYVFMEALAINDSSPDYISISLIVSAASLIGGSASIAPKLKDKSWVIKPTLWAMAVGEPSSYKTPMIIKGIKPLIYAQKNHIDNNNLRNINKQNILNDLCKKKISELNKMAADAYENGDEEEGNRLADELTSLRIVKFAEREVLVTDATPEALIVKLQSNPLGVLLFRDELSGLFAAMSKKGREQERSLLLEGFNASDTPYTQERIGRDKVFIDSVHINLLGGIQPKMLMPMIVDRISGKSDDGFLERIQLAVYPNKKKSTYQDISISDVAKDNVYKLFLHLAQMGDCEPIIFNFEAEAQKLWDEWSNDFHQNIGELDSNEQAIENKYPALVAKLALVFHICFEAESCENDIFSPKCDVGIESLNMALSWLTYLKSHSKKIMGLSGSDKDNSISALIGKLPKLGRKFTKQQLGQKDWSYLKNAIDRNRALSELEKFGYIKEIKEPYKHFIVNPNITF
ncbi:DUF3987 domain-containing protein [Photobacterium iliopiscarium]|uniref:DUF3987 domain-containing protein n=1 Tax=Photobacterium iliopiscarium TaxID=56192 RepID=UPI0024332DD5|nr:DUF3987 domain-containing protein [Photobacterium iliopiscarium]